MNLPFTKMQAVGNDFVVIEEAAWSAGTDWTQEAIRLCDRKFGIGGDGLLVICPSSVADVRMRMFNPDGTEDMCGNGLRCVVKWAHERGMLNGDQEARSWRMENSEKVPASIHLLGTVETLVGVRKVSVEVGNGNTGEIDTEMGTPLFEPAQLPMLLDDRTEVLDFPLSVAGHGTVTISTVNTGSTHTVIWVDQLPEDDLFLALSPKIEHHPLFPERTSVLWATVEDTPQTCRIHIRIWERGVGETLGCGTGACAVAVLAAQQNKTTPLSWPVHPTSKTYLTEVQSRGGQLTVLYTANYEWAMNVDKKDPLSLIGEAHTVYTGLIPTAL